MQSKSEKAIDLHHAEGRRPRVSHRAARDWNNNQTHYHNLNNRYKTDADVAALQAAEEKRELRRQKRLARA